MLTLLVGISFPHSSNFFHFHLFTFTFSLFVFQAAMTALQMGQVAIPNSAAIAQSVSGVTTNAQVQSSSMMATQCFMLNNMFDPYGENSEDWEEEIKNDVLDECRKHGGVLHVHVDRQSQGNVYVKCPSVAIASSCVQALHGRWFSGKVIFLFLSFSFFNRDSENFKTEITFTNCNIFPFQVDS